MALSDTVRRLRAEQAWSQRELARRAKLSNQTIVNVENGRDPSMATLGKLARAFGVRPNALLSTGELEKLAQKKIEARAA
jgi:transcriptional regulator with XRE-family HTH domain